MEQKRKKSETDQDVPVQSDLTPKIGRMVDTSQAEERKMIQLIKERNLLYARTNIPVASYYTQCKSLWNEVAHKMGWTVADVRRKWSHIRNSYSRHLRNEALGARTGKGRMVSRWYLADELEFLREHMATDLRHSPFSKYGPSLLNVNLTEPSHHVNIVEQVDVKPFMSPWFSLTPTKTFDGQFEHSQNEDSSSSLTFGPDENSSYFQFFRGIYNDYKELSPRKQRQFRRQCLNFLHDLLDDEDKERRDDEADENMVNEDMDYKNASLCTPLPTDGYILPNEAD